MRLQAIQDACIIQDNGICGGQPRIAGTRIKVQNIAVEYEHLGWSPDEICNAHPKLNLAQVHAAISYYYAHKNEIDRTIRRDSQFVKQLHM